MQQWINVRNDTSIRYVSTKTVVNFTKVLSMARDFDLFTQLQPTVARCLGTSVTIIAYGQTGSGKTHVLRQLEHAVYNWCMQVCPADGVTISATSIYQNTPQALGESVVSS